MTTIPSDGGKSQDFPTVTRTDSVTLRLELAEGNLACCRQKLADAEREARELRRQQRREHRQELRARRHQRRRALSAKAVHLTATASPVMLTFVGAIAFLVAIVLMVSGLGAANALALAAAAWGGAAAIRSLRK
ncbi:hypothetical protein STRCI_008578 [Streptomyces cinnabarinus]|uniref:DUF3040 domain-containing protein n=1 Tax=Streptomyces cinnabarinus TaxID=67287 RepID=A0ABY7KTC8_9ACTN|nr:hypothetical protein [Streptomyces cinnabarinus]WAZ26905.1 hypothetical protein STRCI_008578 [Streptomyces cinnabarinus]